MPVRTYSSGMYMRLGFAVAVHLDPQVVLIDEAFAVGDERFQRKCLHTIREFQARGVTIVLVSHDLHPRRAARHAGGAARSRRARRRSARRPTSSAAITSWASAARASAGSAPLGQRRDRDHAARRARRAARASTGAVPDARSADAARCTIAAPRRSSNPVFGIAIHRDDGVHLTGPNTRLAGVEIGVVEGEGAIDYTIARLPLLPGRYYLSAAVYDRDLITAYDHRDRFTPLVVDRGRHRRALRRDRARRAAGAWGAHA